jgi:hypothetical protein
MWKEAMWSDLKYCPGIFQQELRKKYRTAVLWLRFEPGSVKAGCTSS